MENFLIEKLDELLALKLEQFGNQNTRNFSLPGELTVTITLDEYRTLVTERAEYKEKYMECTRKLDSANKQIEKLVGVREK